MKKIILALIIALATSNFTYSQNQPIERSYIAVNGVGELRLAPDSLVINVTLRESASAQRSEIDKMEQDMISAVRSCGLDPSKVIRSLDYSTSAYKRKNISSVKRFSITLDSPAAVNDIFSSLNRADIKDVDLVLVSLKGMKEIELKAKVLAIKDAKLKAQTILEAIDNRVGSPIYIEEERYYTQPIYMARSAKNMLSDESLEAGSGNSEPQIEYREVVVKSTIKAHFSIL